MIDSNTKLLVICPSRARPQRLKEMVDSFLATRSPGTEMLVYVDAKDPCLGDYYLQVFAKNTVTWVTGPRLHLVQVLNHISIDKYPNIQYYGEVNDDHIYRTTGWDKAFIDAIETKGQGWGVACGADKINNNWHKFRHPSACTISGNIVRELGFFVLPALQHMWTDVYLRDISEGIGRLFFCPDYIVEHMHCNIGKSKTDDNYKWVYSDEQQSFGKNTYEEWRRRFYAATIDRLKRKMISEGIKC